MYSKYKKRRLPASCIQEFNVILEKRSLSTKYIISNQHSKQRRQIMREKWGSTFKRELLAVIISSGVPYLLMLFSSSHATARNLGVFGSEETICDLPMLEWIGERTSRLGFWSASIFSFTGDRLLALMHLLIVVSFSEDCKSSGIEKTILHACNSLIYCLMF